jgi:hypothetical protein
MAKAPNKSEQEFDTRPDGWQRFEQAVDAAIKSGPKHRPAKAQKPARKTSGSGVKDSHDRYANAARNA